MPARIEHHILTEGPEERIDADSFVAALDASLEIFHELDKGLTGGKFHWYFTFLSVGSGHAVLEGIPDVSAVEFDEMEPVARQLEQRYVRGLAALEERADVPEGFTYKAIEAAQRLGSIFSDSVRALDVQTVSGDTHVTSRMLESIREINKRGYRALGSIEGIVVGITLARRRPTFMVRKSDDNNIVDCIFVMDRLETVKDALGKRVLISGEITYNWRGEMSEVSPVARVRLLGEGPIPSIEEITGLEPDITEGLPSGRYVRERFHG